MCCLCYQNQEEKIMTKDEFYKGLHEQLAKTHGLTPLQVETIRSFAIGSNKTRGDIAQWCKTKLLQSRTTCGGKREYSKKHYQGILDFVCKGKWEDWKDITFPRQPE